MIVQLRPSAATTSSDTGSGRWPVVAVVTLLAALFCCQPVAAQQFSLDFGQQAEGDGTRLLVQLVALVTVLSLAPAILVMVTSFTRIVVVLSLLRTAMGVQQTPPTQVLIGLALFMTFFIMAPTLEQAWTDGVVPYAAAEIDEGEAFVRSIAPFRTFMLTHVREIDLMLFMDLSETPPVASPEEIPLHILVPAFMISELKRAFEIGFLLFLPFLVIDMVVASILMSMGMMMLPPIIISLPFKIIFFVIIDGWYMVAGSLIESF